MGEAGALPGMDRRKALKVGAATVGAAYVAPQVLKLGKAGAATTTTCYAVKYNLDGCTIEDIRNGDNAAGCDHLDDDIAAALAGATTIGNPSSLSVSPSNWCQNDIKQLTLTFPANCTVKFAGYKAGQDCVQVVVPGTSNSVTFTSTSAGLSHVNVVVCCTEGS